MTAFLVLKASQVCHSKVGGCRGHFKQMLNWQVVFHYTYSLMCK